MKCFVMILCAAFIAAVLASEFSISMMLILPIYMFSIAMGIGYMADEMEKEEDWD